MVEVWEEPPTRWALVIGEKNNGHTRKLRPDPVASIGISLPSIYLKVASRDRMGGPVESPDPVEIRRERTVGLPPATVRTAPRVPTIIDVGLLRPATGRRRTQW